MINLKKIPNDGWFLKVGLPTFVLIVIGVIIGYVNLVGLGIYAGLVGLMVIYSTIKYKIFMKKSEEVEYEEFPEIHAIVNSASEYLGVETPQVRTFESDFEEVFAIGFAKPYTILVSDKARENLASDELEFLIAEEVVNIARGRIAALTVFAPDGKTSGLGHFYTKWISSMELTNDKTVLVMTKNIEQSIRTIIRVNDFNEDSEMSIKDMVNIFMNARKSQLQNITDALDLDDYIIDRIVEILKFSRSRDYKKISDSAPLFTVDYGVDLYDSQRQKPESYEERQPKQPKVNVQETKRDEKVEYKQEKPGKSDKYYDEVMGDANYEFIHSEIQIDVEREAEEEFKNVSKNFSRGNRNNRAHDEVAATEEDNDMQNTHVMNDKYNIVKNTKQKEPVREVRDDYDEYDEYDNTAEVKKKIIVAISAILALVLLCFAVKIFVFDKKDKTDKPPVSTGDGKGDSGTDSLADIDKTFETLISDFTSAWAKNVAEGEVSYEAFVGDDSAFKEELSSYSSNGETISYLEVKLTNHKFLDEDKSLAELHVKETIEETVNGNKSEKNYENIYTVRKVGTDWKIMVRIKKEIEDTTDDNNQSNSGSYANSSFDASLNYKWSAVSSSERMTGDEAEEVKNTVIGYNDAWLEYIHNNNKDIFNYVMKDNQAYNAAISFKGKEKNKGIKQSFELMNINDVRKTSRAYYVWVYENIEENRNGNVTVFKKHWIYMLRKQGNGYIIQEFFSDPAYQ